MAFSPQTSKTAKPPRAGLAFWMARVLRECDRAEGDFDPKAVHDLRVALRRCRTIASGLSELDSDRNWPKMRKSCRKLFRSLGALRDSQVMKEWVEKLALEDDTLERNLLETFTAEEERAKSDAKRALEQFDRKAWQRWLRTLPERMRRVPRDGLAFQHMALERWTEANELHRRALRTRSRIGWHRLRIGLKRFRYTVENFLPKLHADWGADLKQVQDLLGEVHDLDMLRVTVRKAGAGSDGGILNRWVEAIESARRTRLDGYKSLTTGTDPLWERWRTGLPDGKKLEAAEMAKLAAWGSFLDRDFAHSERVRNLALELFDGLQRVGLNGLFREAGQRRILECAALLHDVGRAERNSGHHKASYRMIRDLVPPIDWSAEDMHRSALVARYHRGAEPRDTHEGYSALSPAEQEKVAWLAAVLRLADSLDGEHNGRVLSLKVEMTREALVVRAQGYDEEMTLTAEVSQKKHLLETLCGRPVILRPAEIREERSPYETLAS